MGEVNETLAQLGPYRAYLFAGLVTLWVLFGAWLMRSK